MRISRIVNQLEIDSRREAEKDQNLVLKRRKGRDMPLCEATSTNNGQGDFPEDFQQALRRWLVAATCAIASEQAGEGQLRLTHTWSDYLFQQRHHSHGD